MESPRLVEVSGNLVLPTHHDWHYERRSKRHPAFPKGKQQEAIGRRPGQAVKSRTLTLEASRHHSRDSASTI